MDRRQISRNVRVIVLSSICIFMSGHLCLSFGERAPTGHAVFVSLGRLYLIRNAGTRLKNRVHAHAFHKSRMMAGRGRGGGGGGRATRGSRVAFRPDRFEWSRTRATLFNDIFHRPVPSTPNARSGRSDEKDLSPHPI